MGDNLKGILSSASTNSKVKFGQTETEVEPQPQTLERGRSKEIERKSRPMLVKQMKSVGNDCSKGDKYGRNIDTVYVKTEAGLSNLYDRQEIERRTTSKIQCQTMVQNGLDGGGELGNSHINK